MGAFHAPAPPLKFPEALLHGMKPRQPLSALPHTGRVPGLGVLWVRRAILQGIYSKTFPGEMQAWGPGAGAGREHLFPQRRRPAVAASLGSCGASLGGSAALRLWD